MLKTSASSIDGVIGAGFTFLPETSEKKQTKYLKQCFLINWAWGNEGE